MTSRRLRRRRYFDPRYRKSGNAFTSKEEAKSNIQRLLHVNDIDRTSNWSQRIGWRQLVMEVVQNFSFALHLYDMNDNVFAFFSVCWMMDTCYCVTPSSSLYHTVTSFRDSIAYYRSPPGYSLHHPSQDTDHSLYPYHKIQ
uniref:Uncharacterized protein n=1 Tax=Oryza punctata TaxID=4537 RepID=A0A0E0L054_ORYPU